jgi:hypothetical protein
VLGKAEDIGHVSLGDIDLERAREVTEFVHPDKIEALRVDASNVEEMTSLMKSGDYNLMVNATLTDFNRSIIQAAVNAKIHYLDMASDEYFEASTPESVQLEFLVEQLEWAKEFEDAGRMGVILAGGDAGLAISCAGKQPTSWTKSTTSESRTSAPLNATFPWPCGPLRPTSTTAPHRRSTGRTGSKRLPSPFPGLRCTTFPTL